jgi:hypothetical protein
LTDGVSLVERVLAVGASSLLTARPQNGGLTERLFPRFRSPATLEGFGAVPSGYMPISVDARGNFPYYWQDPSTLRLNAATYAWISAGLNAGSDPLQMDGVFTNQFISVLSKIGYALSTDDQSQLDRDQQAATAEQGGILLAWQSAFGALPSGDVGSPPINRVMDEITRTWASPATDLNALLVASDLNEVLNRTPTAGKNVLPKLKVYLEKIESSVPLLNSTTENTALLRCALAALQTPTLENGAVITNDGRCVPAFCFDQSVADIVKGLSTKRSNSAMRLNMTIAPQSGVNVSVSDSDPVRVQSAQLLELRNPSTSSDSLLEGESLRAVTADFVGVTAVSFSPACFSMETLKDWFWMKPIREAIENGTRDVSGFRFRPQPMIDFTSKGNFGFLTSVIISQNPEFTINTSQTEASLMANALSTVSGTELMFLGKSLGMLGQEGGYSVVTSCVADGQLTLRPAATVVGSGGINARAYVLGCRAAFPAA